MTSTSYTAIRLARRPEGEPTPDDFTFVAGTVPALGDGAVLVENLMQSVDPYMRESMHWGGWEKGKGFGQEGRVIGRVVASRDPQIAEGTIVFHRHSWATHAVLAAADVRVLTIPDGVPMSAYLSVLGGTGHTAYVGLTRIARLLPGEDLLISAAAGGVGTATARIARILGAGRIIGITGSDAKAKHLVENVGFDAAVNYRGATPLTEQITTVAPDGVHVFVDNVGGTHLEAGINVLRDHGRIAWAGAVSQYNDLDNGPAAPRNLYDVIGKSIRLEGFLVSRHQDARAELEALLTPHLISGALPVDATIVRGFDRTVEAFIGMLRGENVGKMLVAFDGAVV